MKKIFKKVVAFIFLFSGLFFYDNIVANAETGNVFVYEDETFKVTYIINEKWEDNVVNATLEIENISGETIRNWYLGMSIDGELGSIWDAVIYKHVENHYVIKNATYNSNIASGEKVRFGCIIKLQDETKFPEEFYMPIKTEVVSSKRYEINTEIISTWEGGSEYQVFIINNSKQTIEDWVIEFDFESEISSLWDSKIAAKKENHYILTNNDYNSIIASGESISFGFIANNNKQICLENIELREITSDGIKIAEKLVDARNFKELDIITDDSEVMPLYTVDGQISAYLVQYYNEGKPTGYIVVSNEVDCLNFYIEFGFGRPNMIDKMINLVEAECGEAVERVIYVGGYTYYVLAKDKIYTINNMKPRMLTAEEEQQLISAGGETQYYQKGVTLSLSDIYAKEVGYASMSEGFSPKVPSVTTFKTMGETKAAYLELKGKVIGDHCAPTAGLNMLYYLNNKGYTALSLEGENWKDAFCRLHDDMKTCIGVGTYDSDIESTMKSLFGIYGGTVVKRFYSIPWEDAKEYLSRGAVIFTLQSSQIYDNHFVLGVGYNSFMFSSGWNSRYFKIVDGWTKDYRYVNYSLGIDHIGAITVEPELDPFPVPTPKP